MLRGRTVVRQFSAVMYIFLKQFAQKRHTVSRKYTQSVSQVYYYFAFLAPNFRLVLVALYPD